MVFRAVRDTAQAHNHAARSTRPKRRGTDEEQGPDRCDVFRPAMAAYPQLIHSLSTELVARSSRLPVRYERDFCQVPGDLGTGFHRDQCGMGDLRQSTRRAGSTALRAMWTPPYVDPGRGVAG
jgi:hypothetical protein